MTEAIALELISSGRLYGGNRGSSSSERPLEGLPKAPSPGQKPCPFKYLGNNQAEPALGEGTVIIDHAIGRETVGGSAEAGHGGNSDPVEQGQRAEP
jgi:hypothetical protein